MCSTFYQFGLLFAWYAQHSMADSDARRTEIEPLLDLPLTEDETWCVVLSRWGTGVNLTLRIAPQIPAQTVPVAIRRTVVFRGLFGPFLCLLFGYAGCL